MNSVNLIGRISTEIEIKQSKNTKFLKFNLAVPRNFDNKETDFISCTAFGKTAELIEKYCNKGDRLLVVGSFQSSKYNNKIYWSVVIEKIEFLEQPKR